MLSFLDEENTWLVFSFMERQVSLHPLIIIGSKTKNNVMINYATF